MGILVFAFVVLLAFGASVLFFGLTENITNSDDMTLFL